MEWNDKAIILSARAHGEGHAVAELFSPERGRWSGLVYGGAGRKMSPLLQPGNRVAAHWRGRLEDSLGHFSLELTEPVAAVLLGERIPLAGLSAVTSVALACLPEREAHPRIYDGLDIVLGTFEDADIWPVLMARWELGVLGDLGFGLNLESCAATGATDDLIYISPKSARAVSREAGLPYQSKLLPLPGFLRGTGSAPDLAAAIEGLHTTGYFLETRILHLANRTLPEARVRVIDLLRTQIDT
ncbi:MAG: DNA repair protein RecO [Pseudomonadota bacterium]